jgi:hypothetical protein
MRLSAWIGAVIVASHASATARPKPSPSPAPSKGASPAAAASPVPGAGAGTAPAGPVSQLMLSETKSDALGGRLRIALPPGATAEPRGHSIMAADAAAENETRLVAEADNVRLVVMVDDRFALAGDDFADRVREEVARWKIDKEGETFRSDPLALSAKELRAVAVVPSSLECDDEGCFVEGVFVATAEHEVEYVGIYANAAAAEEPAALRTLASKVAASISPGSATLPLAAGERSLIGFGPRGALSAPLPANSAVEIDRGPDFDVIHVHLLRPFGAASSSLGIYVGGFPSFRAGEPAGDEVTILGTKVHWYASKHGAKEGKFRVYETLVHLDDDSPYLHLFVSGEADQIDTLKALAASLHFVPKP